MERYVEQRNEDNEETEIINTEDKKYCLIHDWYKHGKELSEFLYFILRFKTERETDEMEMQVGMYNIWMN